MAQLTAEQPHEHCKRQDSLWGSHFESPFSAEVMGALMRGWTGAEVKVRAVM